MAGYRRGAVVQLRSGGPLMTIDSIETDFEAQRQARCYWFDRGKIAWSRLPLHMLEVVEEEAGEAAE